MHEWMLGLALLSAPVAAASQEPARFDWFEYRGDDGLPKPRPGEYSNPILQGFYPDPSIVRVGEDYYLANSTFAWFPGMPIFHSRDLVHWTQVGNAIDRPGQIDFGKAGMGDGLYAPDISWNDGTFYILNACVRCGGNFVITAKRPEGPWSDPVWLPDLEDAIDASLFFDSDGSAWIVNNGPPIETPRYPGHRAIWIQQFDAKALKTFGPRSVLVDGGVHPEKNPIWIEGPHIFRKDGSYYLIAAEGGTAEDHSEVVFRSDKVTGPYLPLATNPILTQRDLPGGRSNPITSTGHAQFVETPRGEWWAVFLGVRPYDLANNFNTGRETFMMPVRWKDGWPRITDPGEVVPWTAKAPGLRPGTTSAVPTNGDFSVREDFSSAKLAPYWMQLRNPKGDWWRIARGALELDARPIGLASHGNPSFLARRQQHLDAVATTSLSFRASSEGAEAGIVAYQNDDFWYFLGIGSDHGKPVARVRRRSGETDEAGGVVLAEEPVPQGPIELRITARKGSYDFDWSQDGKRWRTLVKGADGTILSTKKAGGFVGAVFGLYAHDEEGSAK
ncbi:MAG TPA: glycoside hydrolase family 43 protein [Sphingomicrobium sp.]|nr:glycoside hydrolase family 43 protein [Sphingomicrobium sp.]